MINISNFGDIIALSSFPSYPILFSFLFSEKLPTVEGSYELQKQPFKKVFVVPRNCDLI